VTRSPAAGAPDDKLTTDPPRPPGTPDVDDIVGEAVPRGRPGSSRPDADGDPEDDDPVSIEPSG
jgi:hypothetical protein